MTQLARRRRGKLKASGPSKELPKIGGLLNGPRFEEKDFRRAKRSVFRRFR